MFLDIDKVIEESNKEMLYGKKPKVPKRLEKINQIIEYLEWLDK